MALTDYLASIADAIRAKNGSTGKIDARDFPQRILDIPSGDSSQLPPFIETGTFAFEEDTSGPVTIVLSGEPIDFLYRADEICNADNIKILSTVGASALGRKETLVTNNAHAITFGVYSSGFALNIEGNIVTLTSRSNGYPFRAGLTYRWFAWIKEKQEEE